MKVIQDLQQSFLQQSQVQLEDNTGPDDFDLEVDEIGGSSISDLDSDVSKLKEYATGKGPTMREIIQNKKRKDKASKQ
jgi:hypothetical protein